MSLKLIVAVVAIAAVGINGRPYTEEDEVAFDCNGLPDGYYADVSDRQAFYSCMEGALLSRVVCEDGFEYDGVDTCVPVVAGGETVNFEDASESEDEDGKDIVANLPKIFPPEDDDDDFLTGVSKKKIFNIEISKNIFPRSIIIIGKMNREQKNK